MAGASPAVLPEAGGREASTAMIWSALAVVYVVWGSTYLGIRVVVEAEIPPMLGMSARFLTAGVLLAAFLALKSGWRRLRMTRQEALGAAVVGLLLLAFGNGAVAIAEQTVPSGLAALLVAAIPLWVMLLRVGGGDRPRALTWVGVLIGFAGVALLALSGGNTTAKPLSVAILVVGTICWATGSRFSPRLGLPRDPLVAALYEMLFGGTAMMLIGVLRGEPGRLHLDRIDTSGWIALGIPDRVRVAARVLGVQLSAGERPDLADQHLCVREPGGRRTARVADPRRARDVADPVRRRRHHPRRGRGGVGRTPPAGL